MKGGPGAKAGALAGVVLMLAAARPAGAAEPPAGGQPDLLTLERAVALALAENPGLAAERAATRVATGAVRERRAARWPVVEVGVDGSRTTNPVAVFGQLLSQERFREENFSVGFLNEPDPLTDLATRITVAQPIWSFGRITAGVEGAERRAGAAEAGLERARQELVFRVVERYTGAVASRRAVEVRRAALEAARESVRLTRDLFETGLVVESDLLQARVLESEARSALARAESDAAVARAALNLELGLPLDAPARLPEDLGPPPAPADLPLPALVEEAEGLRPDLQAAREQVAAARIALRGARAERLPELGWSGAVEAHAQDPTDDPGSNWTVGLGLRWTGFDGFATESRIDQARARLEEAEHRAELARRGVALEVEAAHRELETVELRWAEARDAVALAERSAEIIRDRYREGLTTVVELLDAETLVSGARTRELQARRELAVARAALDLAVGRRWSGPPAAAHPAGLPEP
ncbi:MAG: TolC family protein, partial [Thermoanaerobaculia bacterium]